MSLNEAFAHSIPVEAPGAALAVLLGILIPLAILLVESTDETFPFDTIVIVDRVLNGRRLVLAFLGLSLLLFLWKCETAFLFILVAFLILCCSIVLCLRSAYYWLTCLEPRGKSFGYRTNERIGFLEDLARKKDTQAEDVWAMVFESLSIPEVLTVPEQDKLLRVFFTKFFFSYDSTTQTISVDPQFVSLPQLIEHNENFFGGREHLALVPAMEILFKNYSLSAQNELNYFTRFSIENFAEYLLKLVLSEDSNYALYGLQSIASENPSGWQALRSCLVRSFFKCLDDGTILRDEGIHIPEEWKITSQRLAECNSDVNVWLVEYLMWVRRYAQRDKDVSKEFSSIVDSVNLALFPGIDNMLWSALLSLSLSGWGLEDGINDQYRNRIRSYANTKISFGGFTIGEAFWDNEEEEYEPVSFQNKTIELFIQTGLAQSIEAERNDIKKYIKAADDLLVDLEGSDESAVISRAKYIRYALLELEDGMRADMEAHENERG